MLVRNYFLKSLFSQDFLCNKQITFQKEYLIYLILSFICVLFFLSCEKNSVQTGLDFETQVVEVTNPVTGKIWMDRNLGASTTINSNSSNTGGTWDDRSLGGLYQWGRGTDGHEERTSSMTKEKSSKDQPGHGEFILGQFDWRSPKNNNLWQGTNGINNPCPAGFRIPTEQEWEEEIESWGQQNKNGALNSSLALVPSGSRHGIEGHLRGEGDWGAYWTSTVDSHPNGDKLARYMTFDSNNALITSRSRSYGFSIRCIKG